MGDGVIDISIAHAAWAPGRDKTLGRLLSQLFVCPRILESKKKEHASVWAQRLWRAALEVPADHHVFLNDDVMVPENFDAICESIAFGHSDQIVSLHTHRPVDAPDALRWFRSYWLTGPGYIVPHRVLKDLVEYSNAHPELVKHTNEDNVIMQYAWHNQQPIWHATPAPVVHDQTVPSTLGFDPHPLRRSNFSWQDVDDVEDMGKAEFWAQEGRPPLVDCPWMSAAQLRIVEMRRGKPPVCAYCGSEDMIATESPVTSAAICRPCLVSSVSTALAPTVWQQQQPNR